MEDGMQLIATPFYTLKGGNFPSHCPASESRLVWMTSQTTVQLWEWGPCLMDRRLATKCPFGIGPPGNQWANSWGQLTFLPQVYSTFCLTICRVLCAGKMWGAKWFGKYNFLGGPPHTRSWARPR